MELTKFYRFSFSSNNHLKEFCLIMLGDSLKDFFKNYQVYIGIASLLVVGGGWAQAIRSDVDGIRRLVAQQPGIDAKQDDRIEDTRKLVHANAIAIARLQEISELWLRESREARGK